MRSGVTGLYIGSSIFTGSGIAGLGPWIDRKSEIACRARIRDHYAGVRGHRAGIRIIG